MDDKARPNLGYNDLRDLIERIDDMGQLLRIDGAIVPLKLPPLSPVETKQLCYSILTEEQ